MIHVDAQPEPPSFDERVRQPGLRALAANPQKLPPHWRACLGELHTVYGGICAYLCVYIPHPIGARSVDHFVPKSKRRDLAYEWSNYRLASQIMNARKREFDDVLDPFEIPDGWFVLEMSFLQVMPSPSLDEEKRVRVQSTIDRLGLNDQDCINARETWFQLYVDGKIPWEILQRWSPFVAREFLRTARR